MVDLLAWQVGLAILLELLLVRLLRVSSRQMCAQAGLNLIRLPYLRVFHQALWIYHHRWLYAA